MSQNPTDAASALAMLRKAHPAQWSFRATTANGRPLLVAEHEDGGLLSARTAEALSAKIKREGQR